MDDDGWRGDVYALLDRKYRMPLCTDPCCRPLVKKKGGGFKKKKKVNTPHYLVHWAGFERGESTWEPVAHINTLVHWRAMVAHLVGPRHMRLSREDANAILLKDAPQDSENEEDEDSGEDADTESSDDDYSDSASGNDAGSDAAQRSSDEGSD